MRSERLSVRSERGFDDLAPTLYLPAPSARAATGAAVGPNETTTGVACFRIAGRLDKLTRPPVRTG